MRPLDVLTPQLRHLAFRIHGPGIDLGRGGGLPLDEQRLHILKPTQPAQKARFNLPVGHDLPNETVDRSQSLLKDMRSEGVYVLPQLQLTIGEDGNSVALKHDPCNQLLLAGSVCAFLVVLEPVVVNNFLCCPQE